ncbi:MAG: hypothetical protein PHD81_01855 [Candidatus Nanoarchaeia archaeon]|nr:hypothetical protein [Candidatus Nanoarchaeia archaeon]MDD5587833.1 hypothetical protein [Candidatus Nanoarchaeia archaeon]
MIWILGILDILSAIILVLQKFIPFKWAIIFPIYIILKSIIFIKDFSSIIDFIAAIFFILAIFGHFYIITWLAAFWIVQKGVFSLFS